MTNFTFKMKALTLAVGIGAICSVANAANYAEALQKSI